RLAALPEPAEDAWAELREAQTMALAEPNTGMAVAIDIGDAADIHPRNKQEVGRRLALAARKIAYGEKITHSGPIYKKDSLKIENGGARVFFDYADGGLVSKNGEPLTGFAIAGADKKFYWADARIEGESVFVRSEKVAHPAAVRFGWAGNPSCNLYNGAGLPASPFRTDDWQGVAE
ncbi:MAG TPA: 9-O-acetylesterase, partial [Candidatus Sumerlaeota bacterium]|nr:9-O-acetylesterase [Candidatus Sumerlaeota bacterium]